jgi:hypothetical protein
LQNPAPLSDPNVALHAATAAQFPAPRRPIKTAVADNPRSVPCLMLPCHATSLPLGWLKISLNMVINLRHHLQLGMVFSTIA